MLISTLATRTASVIRPRTLPVQGRLFRRGLEEPVGHTFSDEAGTDDVVVVEARDPLARGPQSSAHALTIQVLDADGSAQELLLSASSWSRVGLRPRTGAEPAWTITGVLPAEKSDGSNPGSDDGSHDRSDDRALLVAARRVGGHTYELAVARQGEPWQEFACLLLSSRVAA